MCIDRREISDLKEQITKGFADLNMRVDKLEDGVRGNDYYPGMVHKLDNSNDELEKFKKRIDLDEDDISILKNIIRGARNWKFVMALAGAIVGGLAGALMWATEIIENVIKILGKG